MYLDLDEYTLLMGAVDPPVDSGKVVAIYMRVSELN